jgi:hypothetical protein
MATRMKENILSASINFFHLKFTPHKHFVKKEHLSSLQRKEHNLNMAVQQIATWHV